MNPQATRAHTEAKGFIYSKKAQNPHMKQQSLTQNEALTGYLESQIHSEDFIHVPITLELLIELTAGKP